jgi:hypothetical protein
MYAFKHDEEELGKVQLLPIEWWACCLAQLEALDRHVDEHACPEGIGLTNMYELPCAAILPRPDLSETGFVALLPQHGKRFDKIASSLGDLDTHLGGCCIDFGSGMISNESGRDDLGIIAGLDGDRVRTICCRACGNDGLERDSLADMRVVISARQHRLLADWNRSERADLRSRDEVFACFDS